MFAHAFVLASSQAKGSIKSTSLHLHFTYTVNSDIFREVYFREGFIFVNLRRYEVS